MIKNIKISVVLIILILTAVLSIFVLSNGTNAEGTYIGGVNLGIRNLKECKNTYELAWWIANNVDAYMDTSNEDIFYNINVNNADKGWNGKLTVKNVNEAGKTDIWYYTCTCINHTQQDLAQDGNAWLTAGNIVYLETPGKITAYKKDTDGKMKGPVTVDLSNFETAKRIYKQINGSTATFTETEHQEMKKNLSMFIYATVNYTEGGYIGDRTDKPGWLESGYSSAEAIAKYYLWSKDVQKYIAATGLLYSEFVTGNDEVNVDKEAPKTHTNYQNAVNTLLEQTPTLEKAVTTATPTVEYKNGKAYIGPFKANYAGGTPSIQVDGTEVNWVTKNSDNGSYNKEQASSEYVSGQEFYAVIDENSVRELTSVNIKLEINYSKYRSKLTFFRNISGRNQTLMYHAGKQYNDSAEESWTVEQDARITIQKQNEAGANLSTPGIEFEIYEGNNLIGTLTTNTAGKTGSLKLESNKTYTIKEVTNGAYGYRRGNMTDATIISGSGTIVSKNSEEIKVKVTSNTTIGIKNKRELGKLTVNKKGDNNINLTGVEFVMWKSDTGYLRLCQKDTINFIETIETTNRGIDITAYSVSYTANVNEATRFKTNSSGKIVINNLEIYKDKATNFVYWIQEVSNNNYGYKNMTITTENVSVDGANVKEVVGDTRQVKVEISDNAQVNITNTKQLGNIVIHKVGEDNENLEGVKFAIKQSSGWLKLDEEELIQTPDTGIDITKYTVTQVEKQQDATEFETNSSGKIVINNLEVYVGASTKPSYVVKETSNSNYGYKGMVLKEEDFSVIGGTVKEIRANSNWVQFFIDDDAENTEVTITNTKQLGNITIHKVGEDNENLEDVEFVIWQSAKAGYLKLNEETLIETTDDGLDITEYTVTKVDKVADATKFKTNSSGKIIINNLEVYSGKSTKYSYCIRETSNSNYGYKSMVLTEENVLLEGATPQGENQGVNSTSKWVQFEINDDTENVEITIENPKQLANIELIKVGRYNKLLKNVNFRIKRDTGGYIKLVDKDGNRVRAVSGSVTINEKNIADSSTYHVEYVAEKNNATIFRTNSDGKIAIENLESEYNYTAYEISNSNYGYGSPVNSSLTANFTDLQINNTTTITAENTQDLGNISLTKYDNSNEDIFLSDVEFVIQLEPIMNGQHGYLQLVDSNDKIVKEVSGTVIINKENIATTDGKEYKVKYVIIDKTYSELTSEQKKQITVFKTGDAGTLRVENLEVYDMYRGNKYTYKITEINNPNYGYIVDSTRIENIALESSKTTNLKLGNTLALGDIQLTKYESSPTKDKSIFIPNVEFVLQVSPSADKTYAYIALYNSNNEIVKEVKGTAVINTGNKASVDGTDYTVRRYYTDKSYTELSETEKANITTFITGNSGKLTVENLEVYQPLSKNKYEYKLIEINNQNYGYILDSPGLVNATLEENKTTKVELGNTLKYTKISGYVWIENLSEGKVNEYDCLYTTGSTDEKLTNLIEITENNELVFKPNNNELEFNNEKDSVTIKIQLRDKDGTVIKEKPDQFDENGKYTFIDVELEYLADYEVVFEYDGFYYTTTLQKLNEDNGSKVQENSNKRADLSDKFDSVQAEAIISKDGDINEVEYTKDGHTSKVSKLNFETDISANTNEAYLEDRFNALNRSTTNLINEVENVNMGIISREQPHISINSDIYSVLLNFADYSYNYKYNGRQKYYENMDNNKVGVKFEEKFAPTRYTRAVFASDIQAVESLNKKIKVSITYKIQVANQSVTLNVLPRQIINYFDSRYTIKAVGLELDDKTHIAKNELEFTTPETVGYQPAYKSTVITMRGEADKIEADNLNVEGLQNIKDLYITFEMSTETEEGKEAIFGLLNEESTYHNASEILSYTSYYGNETSLFITDKTAPGEVYAGIDKMSQPGNMKLELVKHSSVAGTEILNTAEYEDDTTSAPSLLLEVQESRMISGTIWEDVDEDVDDNEKKGNGILDSDEKPIAGVQVALYKADDNGNPTDVVAQYSNGQQVITTTGEDGSYTFGKYSENEDGTIGEFYGVLPGKYVIKYIYNNQSYIVDAAGNTYLNVNDYKSTIIKEAGVIDKAFKREDITYNGVTYSPERWYTIIEENRYSDAIDNIDLRKTIDENVVKYSTYADTEEETYVMEAYTPVMDIGIEFTRENIAEVLTSLNLLTELQNVDFGIIERPDTNVIIEKQVTSMELTANNGANIIPKGDPSDINSKMQYVKKLDGLVSAEVESSLLQSAVLKLEYTVKVKNNSQEDYLEDEYYIYGTNGITPMAVKVEKVVDYLDSTMTPDFEQTEDGVWIETTADKLYTDGHISENIRDELNTGEYHIFYTTTFNEVEQGEEKSVKFYATKTLSVSDKTVETNRVEIIELSGGRSIKTSIPGNYIPTGSPTGEPDPEPDTSVVKVVITPATGTTVNYVLYIIATVVTFVILVVGIVIIKKKIIK